MAGMLKRRSSEEVGILEKILSGIPQVVKAIEDLPIEQLWSALEAAEGSYRLTLRQSGFSESACQIVTSAIMRRLKGQVSADGLTEVEMMRKLSEELGALGEVAAA
jgi:Phasin protein